MRERSDRSRAAQMRVNHDGSELSYPILFLDVYAFRDGRWQLVAWQATRARSEWLERVLRQASSAQSADPHVHWEGARVLAVQDPDLARIVGRLGDPPVWGRRPGFSTLIRIILEQQVSLLSAQAVYRRLDGILGRGDARGRGMRWVSQVCAGLA